MSRIPSPGTGSPSATAELRADHLVAGAHGQDHGPRRWRPRRARRRRAAAARRGSAAGPRPRPSGRCHRCGVPARSAFTATASVSMPRSLALRSQHEQIAAITVGAEQVRVDPHQPHAARTAAAPARPRGPLRSWPCWLGRLRCRVVVGLGPRPPPLPSSSSPFIGPGQGGPDLLERRVVGDHVQRARGHLLHRVVHAVGQPEVHLVRLQPAPRDRSCARRRPAPGGPRSTR